jgi:hypothetical protein
MSVGTNLGDEEHDGDGDGEEGSGAESAEEFGGLGMMKDVDPERDPDAGEHEGDGGHDRSDEESNGDDNNEEDGDDEEMTYALLGPVRHQEDAAPEPTLSHSADADADVEMEPDERTRSPSESSVTKMPVMMEDTVASPSVPSDMNSIARTPTLGDARSPTALESFYEYPMRVEPSPASSVVEHKHIKDGALVNGGHAEPEEVEANGGVVDGKDDQAQNEEAVSLKAQPADAEESVQVEGQVDVPMKGRR